MIFRFIVGYVNIDLVVVDVNVLESLSLVLVYVDGSLVVVEGEVVGSELLIVKEGIILVIIESKINYEIVGVVVYEDI